MSTENEEQEGLQMSFLDHLEELRKRLIYSVVSIGVAFVVCLSASGYIFRFLAIPVEKQILALRQMQQAANGSIDPSQLKEGEVGQYFFAQETVVNGVKIPLGTTVRVKSVRKDNQLELVLESRWFVGKNVIPAETPISKILKEGESQIIFDENNHLVISTVGGAFALYMHIALYAGIALAIPFLLHQVWAFLAPGLYKHEKRYVVPLMTMTSVFFMFGVVFAYTVAFPAACSYLLGLQVEGGFRSLINAEDYFDLIIMIMIGLGIVFQIPTISYLLARIGLLTPRMMWKFWRHAVVLIAIISAVLTPTTDAFNMIVFATPMLILYFMSIGIVWFFGKQRRREQEVTTLATTK